MFRAAPCTQNIARTDFVDTHGVRHARKPCPAQISVGRVGGATETVEQNFIEIPTQEEKPQAVLETLQSAFDGLSV